MLPTALCAMNAGGCSIARMIMAAPPAVGSDAIRAPTNGPERSTTTEAATTMVAVIAIFSSSPNRNASSGDMRHFAIERWRTK